MRDNDNARRVAELIKYTQATLARLEALVRDLRVYERKAKT